jgi:iron complex transport system ATP-binding protein
MTLRLEELGVRYGTRTALQPCSATLPGSTLVGLVGPNGAGKSSLLKAVAGLTRASGRALWMERPLTKLAPRARAQTVAYLPQAARSHWQLAVGELVALGRLPHQRFGAAPSPQDRAAIEAAMHETAVADFADRPVAELSGGEHARVLLARALAVQAPVLLVDEPVASVDPYHQLQIMAVLASYASSGALVVAVMHDLALAARFCKQLLLLDDGAAVAQGTPRQVLSLATVRRHYRVEPYLAQHEDQTVIVPWRTLD